ncbi:MAG: hypothetical protein SGILL_007909, partial [Bacillariaceae sp.]
QSMPISSQRRRQQSTLADCIACSSPRVCSNSGDDGNNNDDNSNHPNNSNNSDDAFTMRQWSFDGSYMEDCGADFADEEEQNNDTTGVHFLARSQTMEDNEENNTVLDNNNDKSFDSHTMMMMSDAGTADDDGAESIIVEHAIPDYKGNTRRKRRMLLASVCCLMMGVVILTVMLALYLDDGSLRSSSDATVNDGSNVESSVSDNIFDNMDELPDVYYILEPKVSNATALLDPNTAEGKAFQSMVWQADQSSYENAANDAAQGLDLIQRYALTTLYFGTDGEEWNIKDGWSEQSDVCLWWHGIECKNSVVTEINLGKLHEMKD